MTKKIEAGDRVKVEFEAYITEPVRGYPADGFWVKNDDGIELLALEGSVTVIPKPIVLPTKRNALVAAGQFVYRLLPSGLWSSANGTEKSAESLIAITKDSGLDFRVIFEGESE